MKKFLFFLILIPFFASLGHDVYQFSQDPDKRIRFSDLGTLWAKYHPETHDQWKVVVGDIAEKVDQTVVTTTEKVDETLSKILPEQKSTTQEQPETIEQTEIKEGQSPIVKEFEKTFMQMDEKGKEPVDKDPELKKQDQKVTDIQKGIGFVLEQPAFCVFGLFAVLIYMLNVILTWVFSEKSAEKKIAHLKRQRMR
ncbi:MAG: hypothetical protein GC137_10675 [Alphaproteobacteria bacterium]|nr:hypothetical protein [Alphaproteobacteria bacterium]